MYECRWYFFFVNILVKIFVCVFKCFIRLQVSEQDDVPTITKDSKSCVVVFIFLLCTVAQTGNTVAYNFWSTISMCHFQTQTCWSYKTAQQPHLAPVKTKSSTA